MLVPDHVQPALEQLVSSGLPLHAPGTPLHDAQLAEQVVVMHASKTEYSDMAFAERHGGGAPEVVEGTLPT